MSELYRKLSRWPHYRRSPEVLQMDAREYAEWHRAHVLHRRSACAEWRDERREARMAPTPEEREERRAGVLAAIGRMLLGILKAVAFALAALFAALFGLARKENPPRDNRM